MIKKTEISGLWSGWALIFVIAAIVCATQAWAWPDLVFALLSGVCAGAAARDEAHETTTKETPDA